METPTNPPSKVAKKPKKGYKMTKVTPAVETNVAAMGAAGVPRRKIAKVLNMSPETVQRIMHKPSTQELITKMRETVREITLNRVVGTQKEAWNWLSEVIEDRNPRAFDSLTRGLAAIEKISSSASGESRQLETKLTHEIGGASKEEALELLRAMGVIGGRSEA